VQNILADGVLLTKLDKSRSKYCSNWK